MKSNLTENVLRSFALWRGERKCREPIPHELWAMAQELSFVIGISKTCKLLRLNHGAFRRFREENLINKGEAPHGAFVQLPPMAVAPFGIKASLRATCGDKEVSVEFEGVDARTLRELIDGLLSP